MRFRRRLSADTNLNMVPMIDVVFQLILFFMVATTIIITPGIALVLPSSATAQPTAMSRLIVTVVTREEVYINKERFNMRSLNARLAGVSEKERAEIKSVVLDGDRAISYSLLVAVLLPALGFVALEIFLKLAPQRTPEYRGPLIVQLQELPAVQQARQAAPAQAAAAVPAVAAAPGAPPPAGPGREG